MPNSLIEPQQIESALLNDSSIDDCVVRARATRNAETQLVAYVVSTGAFTPERWQAQLQESLPSHKLPAAYVALTALPLTATGEVDEDSLASFEVVDDDLINRWEENLRSIAEIDEAAVVIEERTEQSRALHLADLLPETDTVYSTQENETVVPTKPAKEVKEQIVSERMAISHGETLRDAAQLPINLAQALERAAAHTPTKSIVYLQADGAEVKQTYRALLEEAERILAGLRHEGLQPGDKIIFQLEHNQDFVPAFWACVLGGFVPVPISIAPNYEEMNGAVSKLLNAWQMLEHPIVLTSEELAPAISSLSRLLDFKGLRVETIDDLRTFDRDCKPHKSASEDLALMLLTSGSTGMPKGVMLSHRNIISRSAATAQMNNFTSEDVSLNWFPLDHVGGIVMYHIKALFLCSDQILAPTEMILQEPLKWLDLVEKYRVTDTWAPNFAFGLVNDHAEEIKRRHWDLSSLRFILNGGEAIVSKTARRFLDLLAAHALPSTAMHPAWGMSETSSGITSSDRFTVASTSDDASFVEVGAPVPGISLRIVDHDDRIIEEDKIGRLQVKGSTITSGYYKNPELNREAFSADGWFNTGDLGLLHDGRLTITGRTKDVIIINGVNFYCHEIEAAVEEVAGVQVSYTAATAVREPGVDTDRLAIFFSPEDSTRRSELIEEIRAQVLRGVGVNPDYILPVEREMIPKTAIGKIQRAQLRERFEAGEFRDELKQVDIESGNRRTLPDWFYRKSWRRREAVVQNAELMKGNYLLFQDELGLGASVCAKLSEGGNAFISVEAGTDFAKLDSRRYRLNPREADHYRQLFVALAEDDLSVDHILHLWQYTKYAGEADSHEAIEEAQERGVYSLLHTIQALAQISRAERRVRLFVVASHTQPVTPDDRIAPEKATVLGLLKTIPLELSWLETRHVDLETDEADANAGRIWRELSVPKTGMEVAYRKGARLVAAPAKVNMLDQQTQAVPIKHGGIYLVTGGLGGVGAEVAQFLIKKYAAKLIVVNRTSLPERVEWATHLEQETDSSSRIKNYLALEQTGGEFIYRAVDVSDLAGLRQVIVEAEAAWEGKLAGIFHLAGGLGGEANLQHHWKAMDEHRVTTEDRQNFHQAFLPKVYGTWTLHQLIKDRPEALFVLFSSINSLFGGATFSAYSAANSFLDCYASHLHHNSHTQTYCFNWTMWDDTGMSRGNPAYARETSRNMGYFLMTKEQGLNSLVAGLSRREHQLVVGLDGSSRHGGRYVEREARPRRILDGYYTAQNGGVPTAVLQAIEIRDRFGNRTECALTRLTEMPLKANGEIDRERLRSFKRQTTGAVGRKIIEPRTDLEREVASIWREVLRVGQISINDNFFEMGGQSLLATQVISRLRKAFRVDLPLRSLFETSTIAKLSALLERTRNSTPELQFSTIRTVARDAYRIKRAASGSVTGNGDQ